MGELTAEQERQVKRVKRVVEGWRAVVLAARAVLAWEKPWHPALLLAGTALLHLLLWLLEPSVLTLIGALGLLVNLVDFVVPLVSAQLLPVAKWSGAQEKQLEDTCRTLVLVYASAAASLSAFFSMRETRPLMYYVVSTAALLALAWLGRAVSSGLASLLLTSALLLAPGALQRGLPHRLHGAARALITSKKDN